MAQPGPEPQPDPVAEVAAWLSELSSSQPASLAAIDDIAQLAAKVGAVLRRGGIPENEWLSELRGLQREGRLESFLSSPSAPAPDAGEGGGGGSSGGGGGSASSDQPQLALATSTSRRSEPRDAPSLQLPTRFAHINPDDGSEHSYSNADNALISDAKARGLPSVRLSDVVLPNGTVLRFEVRFQTDTSVAGSRRTEQTWGTRGSPTGMAQVNLDNENTRTVKQIGELGMTPQDPAPQPGQQVLSSVPAPASSTPPGAGIPSTLAAATSTAAPAASTDVPAGAAVPMMQFLHVAGPEENYKRTPYSNADNALISDAKARGLPSVRLSDVVLPNGTVLRFEVRFQTDTSVAGSRRTEQTWGTRGSPTGMAQVNLDNENTRMVEPILPDSAFVASDEEDDGDDTLRATVSRIGDKLQFVKQQRASRWDQHVVGAACGRAGGSGAPPEELAQLQRCTEALSCCEDPTCLKQVRRRSMVLQELLTTERTYCGALCLIRTHYSKPLKCPKGSSWSRRGETIINDTDWEAIFGGFDDVYRFQHRLLQELEAEWISQLAAAAPDKLKPPEGVCYKQRPTMRTWPARYVRIEGKAFNVYDKSEWEKFAAGSGTRPTPRGSSIKDCSAHAYLSHTNCLVWLPQLAAAKEYQRQSCCIDGRIPPLTIVCFVGKLSMVKKGNPELLGTGFGSVKTAKAKIILEGNELLGRGVATYCFDTEATRDRFVLALENLAQGREWHEDSTSSSRGRLGASSTSSCSSVDGSGDGGSGGGGGRSSGGGGGGGVGVLCALPMAQVMADYCELMDVYKAFVSGASTRAETLARLKSDHPCFKEFLQDAAARSGGHSLDSLIITPVQRLPRYALLVGELVKSTPAVLQEERQLMEALLEKLKSKCSTIDAATS